MRLEYENHLPLAMLVDGGLLLRDGAREYVLADSVAIARLQRSFDACKGDTDKEDAIIRSVLDRVFDTD